MAAKFKVAENFVNWYKRIHDVPAKERITFKNEKELAAKIVKARADGLDFVAIAIRSGVPYEQCRKLYFSNGGAPRPYGAKAPAAPAAAPAAKPARKATRSKAAASAS